jgi:hypothetical protein
MSRMRITGSKRSEYDDKGILNLVQKEKSAENEKASSHYSGVLCFCNNFDLTSFLRKF